VQRRAIRRLGEGQRIAARTFHSMPWLRFDVAEAFADLDYQ
jgi:hypothetical protein